MAKLEMTKAGESAKAGPNKVLLIILGALCAVALFMFVVKPLLFGGEEPSGGSPEASPSTQADTGSGGGAGSGADAGTGADTGAGTPTTTPGAGTGAGGGTTEPAPSTTAAAGSSVDAAYAALPADFAGKSAREDPFTSLAPEEVAGTQAATTP